MHEYALKYKWQDSTFNTKSTANFKILETQQALN